MDNILLKQESEALFPNILWSRPENRLMGGKLLIIGGSSHGFRLPAVAYTAAQKEVVTAKMALVEPLKKFLSHVVDDALYLPATKSGGFAKEGVNELMGGVLWADGILLAGDLDNNSETSIVLESLLSSSQQLVLSDDSIDFFLKQPRQLFERERTVIVPHFDQLQKLFVRHFHSIITSQASLQKMGEKLSEASTKTPCIIVTYFSDHWFVAFDGRVSITKHPVANHVVIATKVAVYWLQNPQKPFEAITTAVFTE